MVHGEGRQRIGSITKGNQAQPVACALRNKVGNHRFDGIDARNHRAIGSREIACIHRLRKIERQQDIALRYGFDDRRLDQLRSRQSQHKQTPGEHVENNLPPAPPRNHRAFRRFYASRSRDILEEGEPD